MTSLILPTVLCDRREPRSRVAILEELGIPVWHEPDVAQPTLEFGDYAWTSRYHRFSVGVEVKTTEEALDRFQMKTLQRQLRGLHDTYDIPIFLMGGKLEITPQGYCRVKGFDRLLGYDGFLNWLNESLRRDLPEIRVEHVDDKGYLMHRLASLVRYHEKRENKATWAVAERRPLFAVDDNEREAVAALMYPQWGEEMARRALEAGLSPWDVFHDIMENSGGNLTHVRGIGPERIREMRRVLSFRKEERAARATTE